MALLPQVADLFKDANTWQSFAVSVTSAIALVLPGITPKPPENPPSKKPVGPWVDIEAEKTPPSLPGARLVGLACCALLTGCGIFAARATERCSFANPAYTAQVAACRQEIAETCLLNEDETPREDCPALMRCEEWRKKECQ